MRISWHCNDCEYLHLDDIVISRVGSFVNVRCIVCKETKTLTNPKSYNFHEESKDLRGPTCELVCAYCGLIYEWIDHKHTRGFWEHEIDDSVVPCEFIGHKILKED